MASGEDSSKRRETKNRADPGNGQTRNELSNPCIKEEGLSMKCLDDNNYDKDACKLYFLNYNNCRAFWNKVIRERRSQGITPHLPLPDERDEIKRHRFASKQ